MIAVSGGDCTLASVLAPAGADAWAGVPRTADAVGRQEAWRTRQPPAAAGSAVRRPFDASLSAGAPLAVTRPWSAYSGVMTETLPVVT